VLCAPAGKIEMQAANPAPPAITEDAAVEQPFAGKWVAVRRIRRTVSKVLYLLRSGTFKTFKSGF
jgi:hypothetical protein